MENFSLSFWLEKAENKNFLEYLSALYFTSDNLPFYIYSQYDICVNYLEAFSLAKDEIAELVPIYDKIIEQIFNYSEEGRHDHYIPYPLDIQYGRKDFLSEYIMKTPKAKFHPKAKEYFFEIKPYKKYTLAILSSDIFMEDEKLSIIDNLNHYKGIPKEERKYYEHTYEQVLNQAYFRATFMMIEYACDDIFSIDTKKLYKLTEEEQRKLLKEIVDIDKLHGRYSPYYYDWTVYI